jgi:hypothetical protein
MATEKDKLPATADPDNLYWIMSEAKFMYLPTRTLFERNAVIRQVGKEVAALIEETKVCSNLFWSPGMPTLIEDKAIVDGALFDFPGNNLLNLYKAPHLKLQGNSEGAGFWLELGEFLYGEDFYHLLQCFAFKIQHPEEKINHAIVTGSFDQGIGKDSLLAPLEVGVGVQNFENVTAGLAVEWTNRGFTAPILRRVITRISEVHDLGQQRFKFYDMTKDWAAAPPETLLVADKNVKAHRIQNVVLVIYSTNHKTDGVYIPEEDRRHYVAWSPRVRADFQEPRWRNYWNEWGYQIERDDEKKDEFWRGYWHHIKLGAAYHVVAYLSQPHLLEGFNPGATPPHTAAWHEIVAANKNPQDDELLDVLDSMGEPWLDDSDDRKPDAVTIGRIIRQPSCPEGLAEFFRDPKNSRAWPHRLEAAGYASVRNPDAKDGKWRVGGKRQMIYGKRDLDRIAAERAARALIAGAVEESHEEDFVE